MTCREWTKEEFEELTAVGRRAAGKILTLSAGFEVDDVVAQSLEEFLKRDRTDEIPYPRALMRTIVRRRAIKVRDRWERDRERDWIEDELPEDGAGGLARVARAGRAVVADDRGAGDPLERLIAEGDREALWDAVAELTPEDRRIAELTYLGTGPRKAPDVAGELGIAPGTVRNRLVAIRRQLAEALDAEDD